MKEILNIKSLKLKNKSTEKCKVNRNLALDICNFTIYPNQTTFILGDRCAGKSPLKSALKSIFQNQFNNLDFVENPIFSKKDKYKFDGIEGNPDDWSKLNNATNTLFFCDDPNHNNQSTGVALLKVVKINNSSLILCVDPDRLKEVLRYFLGTNINRKIIWLSSGKIFWEGGPNEFLSKADELCKQYEKTEPHENSTELFLKSIKENIL